MVIDERDAPVAPVRFRPDIDRHQGDLLPAAPVTDPVDRMLGVGRLDNGVAAGLDYPCDLGQLALRIGQMVQNADHDRQVNARVSEVQMGGVGEPGVDRRIPVQVALGHLELPVTRVSQGDPVGVIAEHRRQAIPAAHVHGTAEPAALQQPGQGHHLGAVLIATRRPVAQVVDIRLVVLAENGGGSLAWRYDAHLSPISPSSRFAAIKESGAGDTPACGRRNAIRGR